MCLTFGAWVVLYGIAVLHVQIDQVSKVASAFFLPLSTATLELGTIASATALYNHRVFKLRASEPSSESTVYSPRILPTTK